MGTYNINCCVWHEGQAHRGANKIDSCVWQYLNKSQENKSANKENLIDVVFYIDNCAAQNMNNFILALYIYAIAKLDQYNQLYTNSLLPGLTQMRVTVSIQ